jgi:cytochrome c peroxidase
MRSIRVHLQYLGLAVAMAHSVTACGADPSEDGRHFGVSEDALKSCQSSQRPPGFSETEWLRLSTHTPLPEVPSDPTNAVADDPEAQRLGQSLFFDKLFAGPLVVSSDLGQAGDVGKVSCASCHSGPFLTDGRSQPPNVSLGTNFHTRNAPAMVNSSFYDWTNWGGRFAAQWELPMPVAESAILMNSNRLKIVHRVAQAYQAQYETVFGPIDPAILSDFVRFPAEGKPKPTVVAPAPVPPDGAWEGMSAEDRTIVNRVFVNFGKALAAYTRTLVSRDAPFDAFMAGEKRALSESARRGAKLFVGKARCAGCHSGPHFSDNGFHNLGVPQIGDHVPASDDGQFKDVPPLLTSSFNVAGAFSDDPVAGAAKLSGLTNPMPESARGAFRTPSLRGVKDTAPYMHSGQFATLEAVIEFYVAGGGTGADGSPRLAPLDLNKREKRDLLAFLHSLSGQAPREDLLIDTSAP